MKLPFNGPNDSCPPGSLLYTDYFPTPYSPPTGTTANLNGNGLAAEKLCDVTLTFLYTTRVIAKGDSPTAPTNKNYVVGGHNLLYWHGDFLPHYATLNRGDNSPVYKSFPLELLQADPDTAQAQDIG